MKNLLENTVLTLGALAVVALLTLMLVDIAQCDGTIVRGIFWFECI